MSQKWPQPHTIQKGTYWESLEKSKNCSKCCSVLLTTIFIASGSLAQISKNIWSCTIETKIRCNAAILTQIGKNSRNLKEYWMIYRGPGFLAVLFGSSPPPRPSLLSRSYISFAVFPSVASRDTDGRGGAISYDGEKAWFSINHSILSDVPTFRVSDPYWFNADPDTDPDPAFFLIADPDPDFDDLKLKKIYN